MFGNLFAGRNGFDRYSLFLVLVSLITFPYPYAWVLGLVIIVYAVFRAFSKNLEKRRKELYRFDEINRAVFQHILKVFYWFKGLFLNIGQTIRRKKNRLSQRKYYVFIKCPKCRKTLRLPRHKGRLEATCPVCGAGFLKKT